MRILTSLSGPHGTPGAAGQLHTATTVIRPLPGGSIDANSVPDAPVSWDFATAAQDHMMDAMTAALDRGEGYPDEAAEDLCTRLGWVNGRAELPQAVLQAAAAGSQLRLHFQYNYEACCFTPEWGPVTLPDGTPGWIDRLAPSERTLDVVNQPAVPTVKDLSLAVVYAEDPDLPFADEARRLARDLADIPVVDTYPGSRFWSGGRLALDVLNQVFLKHRAVLFLGHMGQADKGRNGWQLTPNRVLSMGELAEFLQPAARRRDAGGRGTWGIPQVVYANCCFSAGKDRDSRGERGLSYPRLFLNAGVRFFVATQMDVVLERGKPVESLRRVVGLAREFFRGWARNPDDAVLHLYEAKRACGFHPVTALYQIYRGGARVVGDQGRPIGAVITGLRPGDRVGPLELVEELWSDPQGRTFTAQTAGHTSHLVQVLADQHQNNPDLPAQLRAVVERLREAKLGPRHLTPDRVEVLPLTRAGAPPRNLCVLIYAPPGGATAQWRPLVPRPGTAEDPGAGPFVVAPGLARNTPQFYRAAVGVAAEVAAAVVELHGAGLTHGNLDPHSVVFVSGPDGRERVVLKDSWVRLLRSGRSTPAHYAAPEEMARDAAPGNEPKGDVYGVGVLAYEVIAGQSPFDADHSPEQGLRRRLSQTLGQPTGWVARVIDPILEACLVPSAPLRRDASEIAHRLRLAYLDGVAYADEFEGLLHARVEAGHRLFRLTGDDLDEMEATLRAFAAHPHRKLLKASRTDPDLVKYELFVVAEERGLIDVAAGDVERGPWHDARALAAATGRPLAEFSPPVVAGINGDLILGTAAQLRPTPEGTVPVVFVRGNGWWDGGPGTWRLLKGFQANPARSPVFIVADDVLVLLEAGLARSFVTLSLPPASPAVLFETLIGFADAEGLKIPPLTPETAMRLAEGLHPTGMRELTRVLRLGARRFEALDERVLELRDEQREAEFRALGTASYVPAGALPSPDFFALPPALRAPAERWVAALASGPGQPGGTPGRLLLTGPLGSGKTALACTLAAWGRRPLVRLDAQSCLRGRLGESEMALHAVLGTVGQLHSCLVLLDDLDRFVVRPPDGAAPEEREPTLARMESILLDWLDGIGARPGGVAVAATASSVGGLPPEWQRRFDVRLRLPLPSGAGAIDYRRGVFAAVFRRFGLAALADDEGLLDALARETDPAPGRPPPASPLARLFPRSFGKLAATLVAGADIEDWVKETILLHDGKSSPADAREFWLAAAAARV